MLSVQAAEEIILNLVQPLDSQTDTEVVNLIWAGGRILATAIASELDFPHWDNSAMDGYAVLYQDVQNCSSEQPAILSIVTEIPAGGIPEISLQLGQAARILTGAMMPGGADTVIMQERTRREGDRLFILAPPEAPGAFVRHRASFYQAGNPLLEPGIILNAPEIAILAAAQRPQLTVYRRPRVAILSTGDELVTPEQPLQPGQIVDSNQYALAALVAQTGAIPQMLGIIPDRPDKIEEAIAQAVAHADMVLSTGGVSVGDYDYVAGILAKLGAEIAITAVAVKPGKPLTVATFPPAKSGRSVLYFGLPGNPVSSLVSFWRFVQPALKKLAGLKTGWQPQFIPAQSATTLHANGKVETYFWGKLQLIDGLYQFDPAGGSHSSGNLINLAQTNGLAVVPVGQTIILPGEIVPVLVY
jgi:molybdopterin molybdotransferase